MMNCIKRIGVSKIDRFGMLTGQPVPFLGLDCLPPRHRQPDFVAPRHEDMLVIRQGMLPNLHAILFIFGATWKLAKCFDQMCEVWFTKRVFLSKYAVRCASTLPQAPLQL